MIFISAEARENRRNATIKFQDYMYVTFFTGTLEPLKTFLFYCIGF